jgi:hypothetical protein
MTIKVLEHNGIYTAYRRVSKRTDDGELYESLSKIEFPAPPPAKDSWTPWAMSLSHDELEVGIQIYFDKWNFGNGVKGEQEVYELLHAERIARNTTRTGVSNGGDVTINAGVGGAGGGGTLNTGASGVGGSAGGIYSAAGAGIAAALNFPVIKK